MTPITDPNLISQLEQGSPQAVTDPALLSQLNGSSVMPQSFMGVTGNILNNIGQGGADALAGLSKAGMGIVNTPSNIAGLISRHFPNVVSPQTAAQIPRSPISGADIDQSFGTQNRGFLGNLLEGGAQYFPYAFGGEALGATNLAGQAATGAAYGATQSSNPLAGGAKGAATNAALSAIPWGVGKIAAGLNYLKPGDYANQIVNQLSGGRNLEQNAQSLAQDVKNAFTQRVNEGSAQYKPVFDAVGDNPMYQGMQPANSAYQSLSKNVFNNFDTDTQGLHQAFMENPTFQNAHDLQSQLGSTIRQFESGSDPLTQSERNELQAHKAAQSALQDDMNSFLVNKNPALADQYNSATQNWAQNVAPYYENSKINAMAQGDLTNPASIANIFKNPEPQVQKVMDDLGDPARNKIIYSALGKTNATKSPDGLINAYKNLDQQGLSSYVPDSLSQQIASLSTRLKASKGAQMAGGALAGLAAAHSLGNLIPLPMLEPLAMGAGAMLGKGIGGAAQKIMPNTQYSSAIGQALQQSFPALRAAIIPHVVGGQ